LEQGFRAVETRTLTLTLIGLWNKVLEQWRLEGAPDDDIGRELPTTPSKAEMSPSRYVKRSPKKEKTGKEKIRAGSKSKVLSMSAKKMSAESKKEAEASSSSEDEGGIEEDSEEEEEGEEIHVGEEESKKEQPVSQGFIPPTPQKGLANVLFSNTSEEPGDEESTGSKDVNSDDGFNEKSDKVDNGSAGKAAMTSQQNGAIYGATPVMAV